NNTTWTRLHLMARSTDLQRRREAPTGPSFTTQVMLWRSAEPSTCCPQTRTLRAVPIWTKKAFPLDVCWGRNPARTGSRIALLDTACSNSIRPAATPTRRPSGRKGSGNSSLCWRQGRAVDLQQVQGATARLPPHWHTELQCPVLISRRSLIRCDRMFCRRPTEGRSPGLMLLSKGTTSSSPCPDSPMSRIPIIQPYFLLLLYALLTIPGTHSAQAQMVCEPPHSQEGCSCVWDVLARAFPAEEHALLAEHMEVLAAGREGQQERLRAILPD